MNDGRLAAELSAEVMKETTKDWLETFNLSFARGGEIADSVFFRLALHVLPEGVDPDNPDVIAALREIRESQRRREAKKG